MAKWLGLALTLAVVFAGGVLGGMARFGLTRLIENARAATFAANTVAAGKGAEPGYDGVGDSSASVAAEITRLALFLTTPAARHITGETLHVSHGALANFG